MSSTILGWLRIWSWPPKSDSDEPRELTFVAADAIWAEADAFAQDPADQWYRQPADDEPRELTYVDENTFRREL